MCIQIAVLSVSSCGDSSTRRQAGLSARVWPELFRIKLKVLNETVVEQTGNVDFFQINFFSSGKIEINWDDYELG